MRRSAPLLALTALLSLLMACQQAGMLGYLLGPRQIEKPQYVLDTDRVVLLIDPPPTAEMHPLFARELHKKTISVLKELEVETQIVPFNETFRLQQDPDYLSWTVQRIGSELRSNEVVHLQLTAFVLRESPNHPLLKPEVKLRVKVIDTHAKRGAARVWPNDINGFEIVVTRQPREAGSMRDMDREAQKLGRDTAQQVARLFAEWDREETVPVEK